MDIQELKTLAQNRITYLQAQRANAQQIGDVETITNLDAEIAETQNTLNELNSL